MKVIASIIILAILACSSSVHAQDEDLTEVQSSKKWKEKIDFGGYVKYMNTNQFVNLDAIYTDNLIHNRLNFKWYPNTRWSAKLEMRSRVFYGESQKLNPSFGELIDRDNGVVDLSWNVLETNSLLINSTIDRALVEFNHNKWNFRVGRQRINWGMNLAWNPNDLFNTYNFVDFDYQERPGTDAIRVQYHYKPMSQVEVAYSPGKDIDHSILAGLIKFNKKGYDLQFIGANYLTDIAGGFGWAGNLKNIGFKGEATYFQPKRSFSDTTGVLVSSISFDYTFNKGVYLNVAGYYKSDGNTGGDFTQALSSFNTLSAKNILPTQFAAFTQVSGSFTPIFGGSFASMYLPGINGLFLIPSASVSIVENWDLDFVGQILFAEYQNEFTNLSNAIFMRIRWSF